MRFTHVTLARVTNTLHARARNQYINKRGEKVSPAYHNMDVWRHDSQHRLMDPAHDRWFISRENLDSTFEWNKSTIFQTAIGFFGIFWLYYYLRNMVDRANVVERGITLKQIEREHAEVLTFEPFMAEFAAFTDEVPKTHDFKPVLAGRYRQGHRY